MRIENGCGVLIQQQGLIQYLMSRIFSFENLAPINKANMISNKDK